MLKRFSLWTGVATLVVIGLTAMPTEVTAQQPTKTMYALGRETVLIVRLYETPDPLGKTMKSVPMGTAIEVFTDQLYNKYWYKTSEGYYAHSAYLSEYDPMIEQAAAAAAEGPRTPAQQQREDELMAKYKDIGKVNQILAGNVVVGFTMEMVTDAWGQPDSRTVTESTVQGDIWLWVYDNATRKVDVKFDYRKIVAEIRVRD